MWGLLVLEIVAACMSRGGNDMLIAEHLHSALFVSDAQMHLQGCRGRSSHRSRQEERIWKSRGLARTTTSN